MWAAFGIETITKTSMDIEFNNEPFFCEQIRISTASNKSLTKYVAEMILNITGHEAFAG